MKGWVDLVGWPKYKWLPISCRSGAGQWKFAGQRPTFFHWATPLNKRQTLYLTPIRRAGTIFQQGVKVKYHLFDISEVSIFWPQSQILRGQLIPLIRTSRAHDSNPILKPNCNSNIVRGFNSDPNPSFGDGCACEVARLPIIYTLRYHSSPTLLSAISQYQRAR